MIIRGCVVIDLIFSCSVSNVHKVVQARRGSMLMALAMVMLYMKIYNLFVLVS